MATRTPGDIDVIVQSAVDAVLADIQNEFQQLLADPEKKHALIQKAREAAAEELKLADTESQPCRELIRTTLLSLVRRWKSAHGVGTSWIEVASMIVWAVLLTLSAVGIKVTVTESTIKKIVEEIVPIINNSPHELQKAVEKLVDSVRGGSKWEIAKAIFNLIKECYSAKIFWVIINGLRGDMTRWDWARLARNVTAMIAALTTNGTALIASIMLTLISAQL